MNLPRLIVTPFSLLVVSVLLCFHTLHAETEVSGEVYGTWDVDGSPYILTSDLTIPQDSTLYIEPGVTVEFPGQNQDQFAFNVHGTLEAVGTELDSIFFLSEGAPFLGFHADDGFEDMRVHLEYCVVDSTEQIVGMQYPSSVVLRHSRFQFNGSGMLTRESADTLEHCDFNYTGTWNYGRFQMGDGGPYVFTENTGDIIAQFIGGEVNPIHGNRISKLDLSEIPNTVEIYENEISVELDVGSWCECNVHDNTISRCEFYDSNGWIENNSLSRIRLFDCQWIEIHNNSIISSDNSLYVIYVLGSNYNLTRNLIVTPRRGLISNTVDTSPSIINNTFVFREVGATVHESTTLINNIFVNSGLEATGIWTFGDISATTHYNLFHNVTVLVENGGELDLTNFIADPRFAGGFPFDYHLQANSPCIDAGDPDSPEDPDETPADIGAFFYDQSIDNPPTLEAPTPPIQQTGELFRYEVTATDDNGPLYFTFPNLLFWLEEEDELDWVGDTTAVFGIVPNDQDDFTFLVIVEDGAGQTDTAEVFVGTDPRIVLDGVVTGTLTADLSPYYIVADVIVPEGDSLIIEPGCELLFRYVEDEDQRIGLTCYGTLLSEGIDEDTIKFVSEVNEHLYHGNYRGVSLFGHGNTDTSRISYTWFEDANLSLQAVSHVNIELKHSVFANNYQHILITDTSNIFIDSCIFRVDPDYNSYKYISASHESNLLLLNSTFQSAGCADSPINLTLGYNAIGLIQGCSFYGGDNLLIHNSQFLNNRVFGLEGYIQISNSNSGIIANNLIAWGNSCSIGTVDSVRIFNNVFFSDTTGVRLTGTPEFLLIHNNIFLENKMSLAGRYNAPDEFHNARYNCFFGNDSLDERFILDTTNLFIDPLLADTIDYYLYASSPLIDAGNPDSVYNDIDGTRNDTGLWGGPYGESYEYPTIVHDSQSALPTRSALYLPYPNPFNNFQIITFELAEKGEAVIEIFNILGQCIRKMHLNTLPPGRYSRVWDASNLPSGVYFVKLSSNSYVETKKVILLR